VQHPMQAPPAAGLTRVPAKSAPACRLLQLRAASDVLRYTHWRYARLVHSSAPWHSIDPVAHVMLMQDAQADEANADAKS
jgi:hypothetical protein